jgi:hypothetical protein
MFVVKEETMNNFFNFTVLNQKMIVFLFFLNLERVVESWSRGVVKPESRVQSPESRVQSPESRVQSPESRVQSPESKRPESRVQSPSVQSPESRFQSPARVQSPESRVQSTRTTHTSLYCNISHLNCPSYSDRGAVYL